MNTPSSPLNRERQRQLVSAPKKIYKRQLEWGQFEVLGFVFCELDQYMLGAEFGHKWINCGEAQGNVLVVLQARCIIDNVLGRPR